MAAGLEKKLLRIPGDLIQRRLLKEISDNEMDSWSGPINYINHHGVPEPGLETSSLRVVSSSR